METRFLPLKDAKRQRLISGCRSGEAHIVTDNDEVLTSLYLCIELSIRNRSAEFRLEYGTGVSEQKKKLMD